MGPLQQMETLVVNEIYHSIQGESTWAGLACVFVRLTGCHLRCRYCDSEYAFYEGQRRTLDDVIAQIQGIDCDLVEITGGEPLLQPNVHGLMRRLCDQGKTVLIETSGACDISACDPRVIRVMDFKTPASGEVDRNLWSNVESLTQRDEIKFVICDRHDYLWAKGIIEEYSLTRRVHAVLMSPAAAILTPCTQETTKDRTPAGAEIPGVTGLKSLELVHWILEDRLPVRFQMQLHKVIWDPSTRGV